MYMKNSKVTSEKSLKNKYNLYDNRREKMESYKIIKTREDGKKSERQKEKHGQ